MQISLNLDSVVLVMHFSFVPTYPVDRSNHLNIVQSFNQIRLLDYVDNRFNLHWDTSAAHCL